MKRTTAWLLLAGIALTLTSLLLPSSQAKRSASTSFVGAQPSSQVAVAALPVFTIDDVSLAEGDSGTTAFIFTVSLTGAYSGTVTVKYQTANGTAFAPEDYLPTSGTLVFDGNSSAMITVQVNGDTLEAADETFFVNLSNPVGATIADAQGQGTILNDDATGTSEQLPPNAFAVNNINQLLSFNVAQPGVVLSRTPITGLANGETVLGIDFRPATGQLYAFTKNSRLHTINTTTGVATLVATVSSGLAGSEYNIDFDPVQDRLRIVNNTGQNHLVNPDTGAAIVESPINAFGGEGGKPTVAGIAYSNNFAGASSTTLYDIEANFDALFTQSPPASGTLSYVGSLGVSVSSTLVGFDIAPVTNIGYASLTSSNVSSLYVVNLDTGQATLVGQIGSETNTIRDITISTIGPPQIIGLKPSNRLVTFNSLTPGTTSAPLQITGLAHGEQVIGIDYRPANGILYGFTTFNRVVTINTTTGAATRTILSNGLIGNSYGVDFNPVVDRMRLVNDTDQNARVNVDTGASIIDSNLAYAPGDTNFGQDPAVSGVAYTNNFLGATSTTLYGIDSGLDVLVIHNPPNNGTLTTVGPLLVNISPLIGFDIANRTGAAYASLRLTNGGLTRLYAINLVNGKATLIGTIAGPEPVNGIAIVP
ncbi:MAG TPA: DUF4394 domain-containing protein [Pyrinomonadaceae bacterium]|jgi:hypothetical protein